MMTNKQKLLKAFSNGIRPDKKLEIIEWSRKNVHLLNSKKADTVDLVQTPWLIQPLQDIIDNRYDHYNCVMATGSGKSTLATTLATYLILEQPSQTAFFLPTAPLAQAYTEGSLYPSLRKNPKVLALFPANRHAVKRDVILFPHMTLYCRGMSIPNTQSISIDRILVDEAWIAPEGTLQYAVRRLHDRPFSSSIFVSQAGTTNTEFFDWCKDTITYEYHYKCPHCGGFHPYEFKNLKWDESFSNVYYECPCGARIQDTPQNRRYMSSNGKYVELPVEHPDPKKVTYVFNAMGNFSVEWTKLAREFVKANDEAKKKFNFEPLKIFKQQRLSQFWSDDDIEYAPIQRSGYSLKDKEKWDKTFLSVDCQGVPGAFYYYYAVITFKPDGSNRLIDVGMLASFQGILEKQKEWGIKGNEVIIDSAYQGDSVKDVCAQYGWLATNGVNTLTFPVTNKQGKLTNRIYGRIRSEKTLSGKICSYTPYSSQRVKTIAAGLRASGQAEIPHDLDETFIRQLNAERFENGVWKQYNDNNHLIDIMAMSIVIALIHGIRITTGDEETIE